jgi:hypothetical protein
LPCKKRIYLPLLPCKNEIIISPFPLPEKTGQAVCNEGLMVNGLKRLMLNISPPPRKNEASEEDNRAYTEKTGQLGE